MKAFLQGVFDGDGCAHANKETVKLTSTNKSFLKTVSIILLNYGIVSSLYEEHKAPTKLVKVCSKIYNLEITGYFLHIFYDEIGFRLDRKQNCRYTLSTKCIEESGNIYPVDVSRLKGYMLPKNIITNPNKISRRLIKRLHQKQPHPYLKELLKENYFFSAIKSISYGQNEVFDFVIPQTHSFVSNGLISHNTPRGKNHLWQLAQIAQNSPEWFYYKLSLNETQHIPLEEIEKERADGVMSEDMIQQEYFTSFEMGVEGAYYSKYIDDAKRDQRIGHVAWENGFPVHTAWDIGVRDSTVILFFQVIGQSVHIIDCYQNSKQGLEHYANIIQNKPYVYGKHIAPHDIRVKEWGSGITRFEKARQLGIKFEIADNFEIADGIEAVRSLFSRLWIDEVKCEELIRALENYRQEYDAKKKIYKPQPLHDWSSHMSDAMRYLAISLPKTKDGLSSKELDERFYKAKYGNTANFPSFFR